MANDTTPLMLVTNVGLAAASRALPQGPYIHIVKFEIGSAYGYTPDVNQTQLQGNILYGGDPNPANWAKPSDYRSIGDNTLDIILEIPPEAGPWEFGEVAIFAEDQNHVPYLFAIAVFQSPQTKFSSLGTNVVSSYQLNCLLKLAQSTAIFQIDTSQASPYVYDIFQWSDVYPPTLSANPDIPTYNIKEPNSRGDGTLLITTTDNTRTYVKGAYEEIFAFGTAVTPFTVQNSSSTYVEVTQAQFNAHRLPTLNRSMLVQTHAGFWRSVTSVVASGSNYRLNLNCSNDGTYSNYPLPVIPQIGETVHIYSDTFSAGVITYEQIIDPPPPPAIATVGNPGLAYGGTGTYMPGGGAIQAYGLLQSPSQNTGRMLSSADNLNNTNWPSGFFTVYGEGFGFPANLPVQIDGHIWMMSENPLAYTQGGNSTNITQLFFPAGNGGGDSVGNNGYPPYWREWNGASNQGNGQGGWSNWFPFGVKNKTTPGGGTALFTAPHAVSSNADITIPTPYSGFFNCDVNDDPIGAATTLRINGQLVGNENKQGGRGYGRRQHTPSFFSAGDNVVFRSNNSATPVIWWWYWPNF